MCCRPADEHLLAREKWHVRSTVALQRPVFLVQVAGAAVTLVYISTSASRQLGMSATEALQRSLWELFQPLGELPTSTRCIEPVQAGQVDHRGSATQPVGAVSAAG